MPIRPMEGQELPENMVRTLAAALNVSHTILCRRDPLPILGVSFLL